MHELNEFFAQRKGWLIRHFSAICYQENVHINSKLGSYQKPQFGRIWEINKDCGKTIFNLPIIQFFLEFYR